MTVTVAPEIRNIDRDEGAATLADRLIGVKVGDVVRLTTIPTGLTPANPSVEKWRVVKIDEADSVYTFGVAPSEQEEEDVRYWAYAVEPLVKEQTLETEAETGRVYTDVEIEEIRREVRADMQRRSDERLREFKQSIVEKVLEKQSENDWCDAGVEEALDELGLELPDRNVVVEVTLTVRMSQVSMEMWRRVRDEDESWVEESMNLVANGDSDTGDIQIEDVTINSMDLTD